MASAGQSPPARAGVWPLVLVSGAQGSKGHTLNGVYELQHSPDFYSPGHETPVFRQRGYTALGSNYLWLADNDEWSLGIKENALYRRPIAWMHSEKVTTYGTPPSEAKLGGWRGNSRAQPSLRVNWATEEDGEVRATPSHQELLLKRQTWRERAGRPEGTAETYRLGDASRSTLGSLELAIRRYRAESGQREPCAEEEAMLRLHSFLSGSRDGSSFRPDPELDVAGQTRS